jgi:hypothetical protein
MRKLIKYGLLSSIVLLLSCDDIIEEDIADEVVTAIYPVNNELITGNAVNFQWTAVDGADDYRLQVQEAASQLTILDSLVEGQTSFTYIIAPGSYSWRVRGENFAYVTGYNFPEDFSVEASEDLSNQLVNITAPSGDFYTNNSSGNVILAWDAISTADSYTVEVQKTVAGVSTITANVAGITGLNYAVSGTNFDEDATYALQVKALNNTTATETVFSSVNMFLDTVLPNDPTLVSPLDNEVFGVDQAVSFVWYAGTDSGVVQSPITHTLELSSDNTFSTLIDSVSVTTNNAAYTFQNTGFYYWRVKSSDAAGNIIDSTVFGILEIQ